MKELLFQYLLVVTVFLCTPLSYGCEIKAGKDYLSCESFFVGSTNITELTYKLDYICSDKPSDKQKIIDCQGNVATECKTFSKEIFINGTNINLFDDINNELCKHEEDIRSGLPCYVNHVKHMQVDLQMFTVTLHGIRQMVDTNETEFVDIYLKTNCPMWKYHIDTHMSIKLNCSEPFVKLFRKYYYDQMPKKCESIIANQTSEKTVSNSVTTIENSVITGENSVTTSEKSVTTIEESETTTSKISDGVKAVSNIYFNLLLIVAILFRIA